MELPNNEEREVRALQERLSRLSAASMRINESLEYDEVLQGVLDSARSLTAARYGVMILVDDRGQVQDFLSSGLTPGESEQLWLMPDGLRIYGALANITEPLRVADLAQHVRSLGFRDFAIPLPVEIFRFMGAPIFLRGARVGHVFVGDKEGGQVFSQADEETLVMFASQAALVISNARTHREERRARADLETVINTSPVGVVVFDAQRGELASVNREAMRIADSLREGNQPVEELLEVVTCVRADGREVSLQNLSMSELLRSGETIRAEEITIGVAEGRSVNVLLNATPIHGDDGQLVSFVVTIQDMTLLDEQERLRAEFLGMVSHELRMPLTSIRGSASAMLDATEELDPVEMRQFLRIIVDQSDNMRVLIGDLLDVARIETGTLQVSPEPIDMEALIDRARSTFLSAGGREYLNIDLEPDLPLVMADRRRIGQVIGNLLSNASRHSPESSAIFISAAQRGIHVEVSVADLGRGIPEERLPHLFRRFSPSGDGETGGDTGLGLSICRGIVEAHGGRIWAESDGPGLGAKFTFTLPAVEVATDVSVPAPSPRTRRATKDRVRILVVDDDPQALRYVRDILTRAGYAPTATGDPAEVPCLMAEHRPHLVLLDLVLPGTDGIHVMGDVLRTANVPVIFLSAYGQEDTVARALDMGATDYIVKPFSPTELSARVRAALRRQPEGSPGEPTAFFALEGLNIGYAQRLVTVEGKPVQLTATEYAVLYELAVQAPRVLSHNMLLHRVWGPERVGDSWLLRDVVKRLRGKLGDAAANPRYILTEPRIGYRMGS